MPTMAPTTSTAPTAPGWHPTGYEPFAGWTAAPTAPMPVQTAPMPGEWPAWQGGAAASSAWALPAGVFSSSLLLSSLELSDTHVYEP